VPYYATTADVPLAYWGPRVYSQNPVVYWSGATAVGSSRMQYYGNRAEESFTLAIDGPVSNISREASGSSIGGMFADVYWHSTPGFTLTARGVCGHVANLSSLHTAKTVFFIEIRGLTELSTSVPDGHSDTQPACANDGCSAKKFDQADYDPYEEEDCQGDDDGGGSGGTQYYPGDYTGGETVNWGDGVGNGGTSVCGETAKVEYICIDYWNGQAWQEWSCGYATTC
jgi:hypothetical protein